MKTRRKFLYGSLGVIGSTVLGGWLFRQPILRSIVKSQGDFDTNLLSLAPAEGETACVLTTTATDGPFFFPSPLREDVREDREGIDFDFKVQVIRHPDCEPIAGANVEIWHCDAEGRYSGYPEEMSHDLWKSAMFLNEYADWDREDIHVAPQTEARYLRGRQVSDADGWVSFKTIFPGWYEGRVPHVHVKAFLPDGEQVSTQFYFAETFCDELYTSVPPYDKYGKSVLRMEEDGVLTEMGDGKGVLLSMNRKEESAEAFAGGLWATARMGVKSA